jgi:hypothetical protein
LESFAKSTAINNRFDDRRKKFKIFRLEYPPRIIVAESMELKNMNTCTCEKSDFTPLLSAQLRPRLTAFLLLGALICGVASAAREARAASAEAKVKTAYLYNILRYTTWPPEAFASDQAPYTVLILGEDKLEGLLDKVAESKQINKRSIVIKRITSLDQYAPCQLLYVCGTLTPENSKTILQKTAGTPVVVVGESAGFGTEGATVNFFADADGTTGYELNLKAADERKLAFESQLKDLGKIK